MVPMHKAALVVVVVAGLVVTAIHAQEGVLTGDAARGAAVLAEARTALGGDKLSAVKALQMKGRFRRNAGNAQLEGDLELTLQMPDRMKRVEDTSAPGGGPSIVATQVLNGDDVWDENTGRGGGFGGGFGGGGFGGRGFGGNGGARGAPGGGPRARGGQPDDQGAPGAQAGGRGAIDPERVRQALLRQRQADYQRLALGWLLNTDGTVSWVATAESPDGKADVLEVKAADGTTTRLFIDQGTHLPLMVTWQGAAPQIFGRGGGRRGQPGAPPDSGTNGAQPPADGADGGPRRAGPPVATLQMTFADYKTVNGVKLPSTVTRGVNGQTTEEWSFSGYKLNPSLKADFFTKK
jgi:hypothetical protein